VLSACLPCFHRRPPQQAPSSGSYREPLLDDLTSA
jgi:hypothetical protein